MQEVTEQEYIVIRGTGSLSGLGGSPEEIFNSYTLGRTAFTYLPALNTEVPVAPLSSAAEKLVQELVERNPVYASLDRTVQLAILASRQAVAQAGWAEPGEEVSMGINIGSSRGATGLFEQYHAEFMSKPQARLSPVVSPSTTLGNVASWVAQDLSAAGPLISHSVTCSTALQAFANGVAWLKAGMAKRFLVGGTEAPLTPFTLAQMRSIGIYSRFSAQDYPCRPLNPEGQNTFVLGEGAAVFALERMTKEEISEAGLPKVVIVEAVGMGFELSPSKTGISPEGLHFQVAMRNALHQAKLLPEAVDALVLHAPGTKAGDAAELYSIESIFKNRPVIYSNKNLIGHTLGASGALSAELAYTVIIEGGIEPYLNLAAGQIASFKRVMINSAGFGGNAATLLLACLKIK